jgi:hypothetical protein
MQIEYGPFESLLVANQPPTPPNAMISQSSTTQSSLEIFGQRYDVGACLVFAFRLSDSWMRSLSPESLSLSFVTPGAHRTR